MPIAAQFIHSNLGPLYDQLARAYLQFSPDVLTSCDASGASSLHPLPLLASSSSFRRRCCGRSFYRAGGCQKKKKEN